MRTDIVIMIMVIVSIIFPFGIILDILPVYLLSNFIIPPFFLPVTALNILFAIWMVRYYQGKSTKNNVLFIGFLSLIVPTAVILLLSVIFGHLVVYIPTPLQFIVGLLLLWRFEPEIDSMPWTEESKPDLFGISPGVIAVLMTFVTVTVPLGYIPPGSDIFLSIRWYQVDGIYGLLWLFGADWLAPIGFRGFHFMEVDLTALTVSLSIFNLFFLFQMVRYYQGRTSQRLVLFTGIVSLLFPVLLVLESTGVFITGFVWPIPIQLVFGLILLYKIPGPELVGSAK